MRTAFLALAVLAASPAAAETSSSSQAADTIYTFTGTATVTSGGSACLGASPTPVSGDIIVSSHGYSVLMHIKSSSANAAVALDLHGSLIPIVLYGHQSSGTATYYLIPQTFTLTGKFTSLSQKGTVPLTFTDTLNLSTGSFIIGQKANCGISIALTATPGVNKNLLKLLQGVL